MKIGEVWKVAHKSVVKSWLYTWNYTLHILKMISGENTKLQLITYKSLATQAEYSTNYYDHGLKPIIYEFEVGEG